MWIDMVRRVTREAGHVHRDAGIDAPAGAAMAEASRAKLALVLGAAVLAVSSAAVLVRGIEQVHPLAIALWRCGGSMLLLLPMVRMLPSREDLAAIVGAGLCLAAHFATWFASLSATSVLHSTVLVCLSPVWVGLAEAGLERRRPSRGFLLGAGGAVLGLGLMAGEDDVAVTLYGDALAVVAGMLSATYLLLGRRVRGRVPLPTYATFVTGSAALLLLPVTVALGLPLLGYSSGDSVRLLLCVLGPQLIGHNGLNWALRHVSASFVSSVILLEPVGATLLAGLLLGELPGPRAAVGGIVVVAGAILGLRAADDRRA